MGMFLVLLSPGGMCLLRTGCRADLQSRLAILSNTRSLIPILWHPPQPVNDKMFENYDQNKKKCFK